MLNKYTNINSFKVVSSDISDIRNPDILGDICSYDSKEQKFDVVVIAEILEHLYSPHLAMKNIHNILNNGTKLRLTTPFIFPIHEAPHDYFRYTKYGLAFLLKDFKNVSIFERNSWIETIGLLFVRLILDGNIVSKLVASFFIILVFLHYPVIYVLSRAIKTNFITSG